MTVTSPINLDDVRLDRGAHNSRTAGVCFLEAVAWVAGEKHTDSPSCVSPFLADYGRRLNDRLPDDRRQDLRPFITEMPGTANDGLDDARYLLAANWTYRTALPRLLDAAGRPDDAERLRSLPEFGTRGDVISTTKGMRALRDSLWTQRRTALDEIMARVRTEFAKRHAAADAAAVAAAVAAAAADAVADAVAAAVAAAAAAAAAVADAAAVAAADAVAVAAAAADAAAVADAAADADAAAVAVASWDSTYAAVYNKVRPIFDKAIEDKFPGLIRELQDGAIDLLARMIRPVSA